MGTGNRRAATVPPGWGVRAFWLIYYAGCAALVLFITGIASS
jgi:hypothetical protein